MLLENEFDMQEFESEPSQISLTPSNTGGNEATILQFAWFKCDKSWAKPGRLCVCCNWSKGHRSTWWSEVIYMLPMVSDNWDHC